MVVLSVDPFIPALLSSRTGVSPGGVSWVIKYIKNRRYIYGKVPFNLESETNLSSRDIREQRRGRF